MLGPSPYEVAIADMHTHRVQIFDSEGNYKREFGSEGKETDGQLYKPNGITSDAHGNLLVLDDTNRLQVFSPECKHLCTRSDLGISGGMKGIACRGVPAAALSWPMGANAAAGFGGARSGVRVFDGAARGFAAWRSGAHGPTCAVVRFCVFFLWRKMKMQCF